MQRSVAGGGLVGGAVDAVLAASVIVPPASVLSVLSTPRLLTRSPRYGELYAAYRHRRSWPVVSIAAGLALASRARGGQASPAALKATGVLLGVMAAAWLVIYVPFPFSRRRGSTRLRSASAAGEVFGREETEVLGLRLEGEARAYPTWTMARPHAVTDMLAGQRVTLSFCGLTNRAIAYRLENGTGGELSVVSAPNNNILYWDEKTNSLVQQIRPELAYGQGEGRAAATVPVTYTTWQAWHRLVPETTIAEPAAMSIRDRLITRVMRAAHMRTRMTGRPFFRYAAVRTTLHPKVRVFTLRHHDDARAYTRGFLASHKAINDTLMTRLAGRTRTSLCEKCLRW